ncbi:winged helix-turn-helix domain-containing protein [Streptomyces sp. NPDC051217]|uniref:AfsR/SARP family transcriptional regulator n=1 Tax=Streptomyces sp. NPDC051217 TaxID=3365644 RepID=UPI00379E9D5F
MTYRYDVLGATRAFGPDGAEVPVSGARMRALLTALAAAGGRTVPAGRLAAQVWDDAHEPPADEPAALQALIGRLRKVLGGDAIASVPGGYRLAAAGDRRRVRGRAAGRVRRTGSRRTAASARLSRTGTPR